MDIEAFKKLLFIINPKAGQKKKEDFLVDVINKFEDYKYRTEVHYTREQGDGERILEDYGKEADLIVCMGGDGTLNEVIEGMVDLNFKIPIGYIPAGSTNDFASSLDLPIDPLEAAEKIMTKRAKPIDIGSFNGRYFVYTASCGVFTRASYETSQSVKNLIGHFAYILEGVKDLTNVKNMKLEIQMKDKTIKGEYIFVAICNATSIGGIMTIDKEMVNFSDGLFELLLVKFPKDLIELGIIISKLQNQVYDDSVMLIPISEAYISDSSDIDWSLDGEKEIGTQTIEFNVIQDAVNIIY